MTNKAKLGCDRRTPEHDRCERGRGHTRLCDDGCPPERDLQQCELLEHRDGDAKGVIQIFNVGAERMRVTPPPR